MTRETRCRHEFVQWPDLGLSSCATCRGLAHDVSLDDIEEVPLGRLHVANIDMLDAA